jgi:CHAD domain-containing protein
MEEDPLISQTRHYAGDVTILATSSPGPQDLATFDTSLQLGESEPLGTGVKRVAMDQLERAASGFFDGHAGLGSAVHESRKSIKRVRALLRMVRGELPDQIFDFENKSLRDTARLVAEVRMAQGVLDAASSIHNLYDEFLSDGTFGELIQRLSRRRDLTELKAVEDPNLIGRVVRGLERAYHRYGSWPTDPEAREIYGLGIRDSFDAVRPGLTGTYNAGRQGMVQAYRRSAPGDFHEWRKRVKDMRHQLEFLAPLWPEVVVGTAMTLDRLGDILGDDNDMAELLKIIRARPDLCPNPRERSLFRALANQRRSDLQVAAEILGRRVYAEKPDSLSSRFGEYWDARLMAIRGSLDTIVVY